MLEPPRATLYVNLCIIELPRATLYVNLCTMELPRATSYVNLHISEHPWTVLYVNLRTMELTRMENARVVALKLENERGNSVVFNCYLNSMFL